MPFFDTHCHLLLPRLAPRKEEILQRCLDQDVTHLTNMALGPGSEQLEESLALSQSGFKGMTILTAAGIHPHNAKDESPAWYDLLEGARQEIAMVGEIGLDFHYNYSLPERQREVFARQLDWARQNHLPVIMHIREAHEETLDLLSEIPPPEGSIVHCYTGDAPTARRYLDLGCYISFSGIVTFNKAVEIQQAATMVPMDRILVETDSPYLAPVPYRGKTCEPWHVIHTAHKVAQLKTLPDQEVFDALWQNSLKAFSLKEESST